MKKKNETEVLTDDLPVPVAKIKEFHVELAHIRKIVSEYALITVDGVKDHAGFKKLSGARKELKTMRVKVDARRKELNAGFLEKIRSNNKAGKFIIGELFPTELLLRTREKEILNQKEAIRLEKKRIKMERLQKRVEQLNAFEVAFVMAEVEEMTDQEFTEFLSRSEISFKERAIAKEQNAKKMAEEQAKLLQENAILRDKLSGIAMNEGPGAEGDIKIVILPEELKEETIGASFPHPTSELSEDAKKKIYHDIQVYIDGLKSVPIPRIDHMPSKIIFLNAHSKIMEGIAILQDAIK